MDVNASKALQMIVNNSNTEKKNRNNFKKTNKGEQIISMSRYHDVYKVTSKIMIKKKLSSDCCC